MRSLKLPPALIALIAGALSALGFAPWDLWPITIIAVAVLCWLVHTAGGPWAAAGRAWVFGWAHFAASLPWIAKAFTYQAKMPAALGWVAVLGLSAYLALFIALAGGLAYRLGRRPAARVLALAASWVLAEWLRGWVLTGFAWNPLGAIWLEAPGLAQLAAWIGSAGLSALAVLAGGALWLAAIGTMRERLAAGGTLAVLAVLAAIGLQRINPSQFIGTPIIIVQPDIGQGEKYDPARARAHMDRYVEMTATALARLSRPVELPIGDSAAELAAPAGLGAAATTPPPPAGAAPQPAMVVWPEGAVDALVEVDEAARRRLASALRPGDVLLFGGTGLVADKTGRVTAYANSLFVLDSRARLIGRYDKSHLVPLGEYVPARGIMEAIGLARLVPGDYDFAAGPGPRTLALPAGLPAVGPLVCYEIIFPGAVVDPEKRPGWLANVSNDAWYGASGPPQHLAQSRLRAIEEGLPVARATPTGVSAMVSAYGRVRVSIAAGRRDVISTYLPPPLPRTLFSRRGHLVPGLLAVLLLGAGLLIDRRKFI
jgi:apolipoprotein N-acyltransferase